MNEQYKNKIAPKFTDYQVKRDCTLLDFLINDGRFARINHVNLILDKINCFHCIVLRKQYGHRKTDVSCSCYCDFHVYAMFDSVSLNSSRQ